jgi:hypothetical protein
LSWNNSTNTLSATTFAGAGSSLTGLNATNMASGTLAAVYGGTGSSNVTAGRILAANGSSALINSANLTWDNTNSRLGIAMTNPLYTVDVSGTVEATLFMGSGASLTGLNSSNVNTGTFIVTYGGTGSTTLTASKVLVGNGTGALIQNTNLHWDNTNSRLGIGKSNPTSILDVSGTITSSFFSGDGSLLTNLPGGDTGWTYDASSNKVYSGANVLVGIGVSNVTEKLEVSGNIVTSGDITAFGTVSDLRLKTKITTMTNSLDKVNQLNPVTFFWKDDIFNAHKRGYPDVGFIAQEVEQIVPLACTSYKPPSLDVIYKGIKHERLIPYLVDAIKKLHNRVSKLEMGVM